MVTLPSPPLVLAVKQSHITYLYFADVNKSLLDVNGVDAGGRLRPSTNLLPFFGC